MLQLRLNPYKKEDAETLLDVLTVAKNYFDETKCSSVYICDKCEHKLVCYDLIHSITYLEKFIKEERYNDSKRCK